MRCGAWGRARGLVSEDREAAGGHYSQVLFPISQTEQASHLLAMGGLLVWDWSRRSGLAGWGLVPVRFVVSCALG